MAKDIRACLRCGSRDVRMLTIADGLWPDGGETLKWVCHACDWQGAPLLFDDEQAWDAFRAARRAG